MMNSLAHSTENVLHPQKWGNPSCSMGYVLWLLHMLRNCQCQKFVTIFFTMTFGCGLSSGYIFVSWTVRRKIYRGPIFFCTVGGAGKNSKKSNKALLVEPQVCSVRIRFNPVYNLLTAFPWFLSEAWVLGLVGSPALPLPPRVKATVPGA